jgi:hypothetical protein
LTTPIPFVMLYDQMGCSYSMFCQFCVGAEETKEFFALLALTAKMETALQIKMIHTFTFFSAKPL